MGSVRAQGNKGNPPSTVKQVAEDDEVAREIRPTDCSLDTCFDFARCDGRPFKVSLFCAISKCDQIMGIPMRFCFDVLNWMNVAHMSDA